jgi:translocation and assembly module TamB
VSTPRPKSRWRMIGKLLLYNFLGVVLVLAGVLWYTTTNSFRQMVERRLVAELELVTGGRVDLGGFKLAPFHFRAELDDLTIHGREPAGEPPLVHVDRLVARVKVISVLESQYGFHWVVIDHPSIHLITYPDGTTNYSGPKEPPSGDPIQQFFDLSISRLDVRHGVLLLNDHKMPLDFSVNDLSANMQHSLLRERYQGNLLLGRIETRFDGYRPVAWTAEAHFDLAPKFIEVSSLKASAHGAHLEASGRVDDFLAPKVEATYTMNVDLAQAAAVARRPELRRGSLQASGKGTWSAQGFSSQGKLSLDGFDWRDSNYDLRNARLNTPFAVTQDRITLPRIQARVLGGDVSGDLDVTNWLASTPNGPKVKPALSQQGTAHFRWKGLSVPDAVSALPRLSRTFGRVHPSGSADGTVDARWRGSFRDSETQIALDVAPPSPTPAGQLAVTAHARLSYSGPRAELSVQDLTASTPRTQLQASGTLSSSSGLNFSVTTDDLEEWQPLWSAFRGPEHMPVTLRGKATFHGVARGKLSDVSLAGNLHVENFASLVPATSQTPEREVHWDSLTANVEASQHALAVHNATLRHGDTEITFRLDLGLQHGQYAPQSPLSASVDAHRADLAELLSLAGRAYPVTGEMDLQADVAGTRGDLHGDGHVQITNATVYGENVQHFRSRIVFSQNEGQLEGMELVHDGARLNGDAAYDFSSRSVRFDLQGKNVDLAKVRQIQTGRISFAGFMDFQAKGSGTLDTPVLNATVSLRELALNNRRVGDFTLVGTTQGPTLHLTGHSQFEQADLKLDGDVQLRGDWPCDLMLHLTQLDATPILRIYMKVGVNTRSMVSGNLRVQGPLRRPRELRVTGSFDQLEIAVEDFKMSNQGPVQFTVSDQVLKLEPFHLTGDRTNITGSGTVHLTGDRRIDASAHGRVSLRLIETFDHDFTSSGVVTVDMTLAGTVANPTAQGRLEIQNGSVAYIDLPSALSEINGALTFNQDRVQIEKLTARTGGGLLDLQGFATARNHQLAFDLTAHGEDVRLRYPPGVSSTASLDLRFAGTSTASTLSGNITVTRLAMTPGFDFAAYVAATAKSPTLSATNPTLNRIRLDVHVVTTPELQMQTSAVRISGDADLRLRGSVGKPALVGRVDATEGELYFNGTKYTLERAEVNFLPSAGIKPSLDLQMSTRVRDYDINVSINGEPSRLRLNYRSEPPLPEADIIALLALGRTREEAAQLQQSGSSALGGEASNVILTEALNAAVSSRVQHLFGGSRIKIDPQGLNTETSTARGPQVTIEQQVTNNLTLTYSTNVSQTTQQIIQLEYNVSRNLSIVALRDQNGVVSFDVRIRRRKK